MGGYHFKSADCGIVLEVTIMFADIVRAHGWSSTESRYFLSIYDLDEIARRHGLKVGQSQRLFAWPSPDCLIHETITTLSWRCDCL
jgi:hypothetical protein